MIRLEIVMMIWPEEQPKCWALVLNLVLSQYVKHEQFLRLNKNAKERNGIVHIDIASLNARDDNKVSSNSNLRIIDKKAQLTLSDFFDVNIGIVGPIYQLFHKWKEQGMTVNIVRCKNKTLKARCNSINRNLNSSAAS
jgi:hypothetical protein